MGRRDRQKLPEPQRPEPRNLRRDLLIAAGLTAITWAVFWPACRFDFVDIDDNSYVYRNPNVLQGLTWEGVRWAMTAETVGTREPRPGIMAL